MIHDGEAKEDEEKGDFGKAGESSSEVIVELVLPREAIVLISAPPAKSS